jgi:signal-transduction protein with cAMP-binding, CBS, and nucleotidyltransferase domain
MTPTINILRNSPVTTELSDAEVELLWKILDVHNYQSGEVIATPCDAEPESLYLLVHGCIEVRLQSLQGLRTIHVVNPGELANIIAFAGGHTSGVCATLHAVGLTRALSLSRIRYEQLIYTHPSVVYRFSQGLVRYVHHIMRHLNTDLAVLNKQITCTGVDFQMRQGSVPVANRAASASCTTIAREVVTG